MPAAPAVAVIVKVAELGDAFTVLAGIAASKVTVQVNNEPAAAGNVPQFTADTCVPVATPVGVTPAGICSLIVTEVPVESDPPLLPIFKV